MIDMNSAYMQKAKARLDRRLTITPGCWLWTGALDTKGYGLIGFRKKVDRAHRVAYLLTVGEIPEGMKVLHRCDNPKCANPDHLFLGTTRDNNADRHAKGRSVMPDNRGPRNGQAKLSEAQVRAIRSDTRLHREIASDFNIAAKTVSDIKLGKRWKHV